MKHVKTISEKRMIPATTGLFNCSSFCQWKKGLFMSEAEAQTKCAEKSGTSVD